MFNLNEQNLRNKLISNHPAANFSEEILDHPEKVVQFGEGNFLRAFFNWMLHEMNKQGIYEGQAVVIQPIPPGRVPELNVQDCLYTLLLRGIEEGEEKEEKEIVTSISRGLESYKEWGKVLELAENPEIEIIVSNTTEAGINYKPEDNLKDEPPESFPAKLTAWLKYRYDYFSGDKDCGLLILPVELIKCNGDRLKEIVLKLASDWDLEEGFIEWLEESNDFLNTLVDRIVPGYPEKEAVEIEEELGYRDKNITTGEIYHLWVVEGEQEQKKYLPLHEVGLNVKWVDNISPYRTRKVRILNGAHTSTVPVAYLSGIDLVREAVEDEKLKTFIETVIFEEIIPTLDFDREELKRFAEKIIDRFRNPYIDHEWIDIALNSTSKFRTRVLPSIKEHEEKHDYLPKRLVFSLAALISFYRGKEMRNGKLLCENEDRMYMIDDNEVILEFFKGVWSVFSGKKDELEEIVEKVLGNKNIWEEDLRKIPGLKEKTKDYLIKIENKGMRSALTEII